jgi:hypothetical protein
MKIAMRAATFWRTVTLDRSNFLDALIALFQDHGVRFCVIGGQGLNAYVEPLVSLDLDLVIAAEHMDLAEALLRGRFDVEVVPQSLSISALGSELRVRIQTDPRYFAFVDRASRRDVLGISLPVASIEDILQGKIWAASDPKRRPSKRRKDLLDIERIIEEYPGLRPTVPPDILARLQ